MPAHATPARRSGRCALGLALSVLLLAGCASQQPAGYYDNARDSTARDAAIQAQGRTQPRAPGQIQLGFGENQKKPAAGASAEQAGQPDYVRPLAEAKTYLGTIPCLVNGNACSASRVTLTLAPSGQWRARTLVLDGPNAHQSTAQQGCWEVIGSSPLRILLQLKNGNTKASLTFINDNQLHIDSIDNRRPNLDYRLTRQADIDGIGELDKSPSLSCNR